MHFLCSRSLVQGHNPQEKYLHALRSGEENRNVSIDTKTENKIIGTYMYNYTCLHNMYFDICTCTPNLNLLLHVLRSLHFLTLNCIIKHFLKHNIPITCSSSTVIIISYHLADDIAPHVRRPHVADHAMHTTFVHVLVVQCYRILQNIYLLPR